MAAAAAAAAARRAIPTQVYLFLKRPRLGNFNRVQRELLDFRQRRLRGCEAARLRGCEAVEAVEAARLWRLTATAFLRRGNSLRKNLISLECSCRRGLIENYWVTKFLKKVAEFYSELPFSIF